MKEKLICTRIVRILDGVISMLIFKQGLQSIVPMLLLSHVGRSKNITRPVRVMVHLR